jgi:hypothetical protein
MKSRRGCRKESAGQPYHHGDNLSLNGELNHFDTRLTHDCPTHNLATVERESLTQSVEFYYLSS